MKDEALPQNKYLTEYEPDPPTYIGRLVSDFHEFSMSLDFLAGYRPDLVAELKILQLQAGDGLSRYAEAAQELSRFGDRMSILAKKIIAVIEVIQQQRASDGETL